MKYIPIILLLVIGSCQKETPEPAMPIVTTPNNQNVECTYNGQTMYYNDVIAASNLTATWQIIAGNTNGTPTEYNDDSGLTIKITNPQIGTFQLESTTAAAQGISLQIDGVNGDNDTVLISNLHSSAGTITVTNIDYTTETIIGTFETNVSNGWTPETTKYITGSFNVKF